MSTPPSKTIFIVGAGASKEARLATGSELKSEIAGALRFDDGTGDQTIYDALSIASKASNPQVSIKEFLDASRHISKAIIQSPSIDQFMHEQRDNNRIQLCGKLAIIRSILIQESKSDMAFESWNRPDPFLMLSKLEKTWFNSFWEQLKMNCSVNDLKKQLGSVALIVFNYDRCIEHYLYHSLQIYYNIVPSDAAKILSHLVIYHPYGTVGSLPWHNPTNEIKFGGTPNSRQLQGLADQIKTFTEGTDESSSEIKSIRADVRASNRLIFLGFAFHPMNMEQLLPRKLEKKQDPEPDCEKLILATTKGLSTDHAEFITKDLFTRFERTHAYRSKIKAQGGFSCLQLFHQYAPDMSLIRST